MSEEVPQVVEEKAEHVEEQTEKEEKQPRKRAAKPVIPFEQERKSARERKVVDIFVPPVSEKEEREIEVLEGSGTPLGDIENVVRALEGLKSADPLTKKVHSLLYGFAGKKTVVKKNIRLFKGIPEDQQEAKKTLWTEKFKGSNLQTELKPICQLFDLEISGTKEAVISRICDFMVNPQSSGKSFKGSVKSVNSASKKKGSKRKTPSDTFEKRSPTAFIKFSSAKRAAVREENPEASFGEIGKILGGLWREQSDSEKASWATGGAQSSGSAKKSKPSKKSKVESEEEADETSDEDVPLKNPTLSDAMHARIKAIIAEGNLETLSIKKVKTTLKEEFGDDEVEKKGALIKSLINELVASS